MHSVSGPGSWGPLPAHSPLSSQRKTSGPEPQLNPEAPRSDASSAEPSLIHPGTAPEFRRPLQAILRAVPLPLLRALARQGYCVHVIDTHGFHPLTLEIPECDPLSIWRELPEPRLCLPATLDEPLPMISLAQEFGAASQDELLEWCELLCAMNPSLQGDPVEGDLLLPGFGYWFGRRLPAEFIRFLRHPHEHVGAKAGSVAAMVTHGALPGWAREENRILFWDKTFRGGDALQDWYVLHEIGHVVDYSFAFIAPELWRAWSERVEALRGAGRGVTSYAGTDRHEYFAEAFAAWTRLEAAGPRGSDLAGQRRAASRASLDEYTLQLIEEAVQVVVRTGVG